MTFVLKEWIAKVTERIKLSPKTAAYIRPLAEDQKSNWTYTVPHSGVLYLWVISSSRTYCTITLNGVNIGDFALPTTNPNTTIPIPIIVGKGDVLGVNNLSSSCYLGAARTTLIPWGGVLLSSIFKAFSHLQKNGGGLDAKSKSSYIKDSDLSQRAYNYCELYAKRTFVLNLVRDNLIQCFEGRVHSYSPGERFLKSGGASLLLLGSDSEQQHCNSRCKPSHIRNGNLITVDNYKCAIYQKRFCDSITISERRWAAC